MHYYPDPEKKGKIKIIGAAPDESFPCGYFDGATAESQGGVGIYIAISSTHLLAFKIGCGRAELLALWTILFVSVEMGIPINHIYGDSSVIINWENKKAVLSSIELNHWCENTRSLLMDFDSLGICHVYREQTSYPKMLLT